MRRRVIALGVGAIVAVVVGSQFHLLDRTPRDGGVEPDLPPEVRTILVGACYDCHSDRTEWPWYSHVAPLSWWLEDHVLEARGDLDFTRWDEYDEDEQLDRIEESVSQVDECQMPPRSYALMHSRARLDDEARATLREWMKSAQDAYSESSGLYRPL